MKSKTEREYFSLGMENAGFTRARVTGEPCFAMPGRYLAP